MSLATAPSATRGDVSIGGSFHPQVIRSGSWMTDELRAALRSYRPGSDLGRIVKHILTSGLSADAATELFDAVARTLVVNGTLRLKVLRHPESPLADPRGGKYLVEDYGVVDDHLIDTSGVNYLATQLKNQAAAVLNYHALGTGTTAAATADTALVTEWAASDYTSSVRATGTQTNPSANVMRTLATNTKVSAGSTDGAVTEMGVFTVSTPATATLWDRFVFTVVNLSVNDSLQSTADFTFAAGG